MLGAGEEGVPKYVNSPESPIYHKGQVLYGLGRAKNAIRREGAALVVEGYMDVVSLAAAGVENAVAPLGTSMTEEQAALLARYCKRTFLLFDSDRAGLAATFRAGDLLLAAGVQVSVVTLPPGEDPDTVVHGQGVDALRAHVDDAVDLLDRKLQILEGKDYFSSIERIRGAVDRLLPTLRAVKDPALRDIYVARVAERTGVRRETLEEELARTTEPARERPRRPQRPRPAPLPSTLKGLGAERTLLLLLVKDRDWIERAGERLAPEDFVDPTHRSIFEALVTDPEMAHPPDDLDPGARRVLEELLADRTELPHAGRVFAETVARILARREEEEARRLTEGIGRADSEEEWLALLREKDRLRRSQVEHGTAGWHTAARRIERLKNEDGPEG
ncbi:MAG: toprim domain-containing protein [Gemmatimonadetes bacterium]|nr:MAG: toprim domain-containing protein [Gemmatimonadota bacterium]